jgi:hypothetical protein
LSLLDLASPSTLPAHWGYPRTLEKAGLWQGPDPVPPWEWRGEKPAARERAFAACTTVCSLSTLSEIRLAEPANPLAFMAIFVGSAAKHSMHFFCSVNEFITTIMNNEKYRRYKQRD